jgi:ankyrin repeat protein
MAAQEAVDAIFRAASERDVGEVVRLLDAQPDLLEVEGGAWGGTLLCEAAWEGHAELATVLLGRGADVNRGNRRGDWAPLVLAAYGGHGEVVTLLLRAGASFRWRGITSAYAWTALGIACSIGHLGVVRLLLRHMRGEGLDEISDGGSCPALGWACMNGHAEVCRALLLAGADYTIASKSGGTPRQMAQRRGHDDPCLAVFEVSTPDCLADALRPRRHRL